MNLQTHELGDIFAEIQTEFSDDPVIRVEPVAGDPPNQYDITYELSCTSRDERGNIAVTSPHSVTISIPFGFPHFPPSCKPKSAIFHPDFDPAAICLGSFWDSDRNLPELIRYIGRMISGEIYSRDHAFNEEAALWFAQHTDELPFSSYDGLSTARSTGASLDGHLAEGAKENELGTLEDRDFVDDLDYDHQPATPPPLFATPEPVDTESQEPPEIPIEKLLLLAEERKFQALAEELASFPQNVEFAQKQILTEQASSALRAAHQRYDEAQDLEDEGNTQLALHAYLEVETLVADYPRIKGDISRVEQAVDLLSEFSTPSSGAQPENDTPATRPKKPLAAKKAREARPKKTAGSTIHRRPLRFAWVAMGGAALCLIALFAVVYLVPNSRMNEARQLYSDCTSHLARQEFEAADRTCRASLAKAQSIYLGHDTELARLTANIEEILQSKQLRQGVLGNVLFEGKYIPKELLAGRQAVAKDISKADSFADAASWKEAENWYRKALNRGRGTAELTDAELAKINHKIAYAQFQLQLSLAEQRMGLGQWQQAIDILENLQTQLDVLAPDHRKEYQQKLETLLAKSRFSKLKQQANTLFSKSDWKGAFSLFQKAVEAGRDLSATESQEVNNLQEDIAKAELYSTINSGNSAFAAGAWDDAIHNYRKAQHILKIKRISSIFQHPKRASARSIALFCNRKLSGIGSCRTIIKHPGTQMEPLSISMAFWLRFTPAISTTIRNLSR